MLQPPRTTNNINNCWKNSELKIIHPSDHFAKVPLNSNLTNQQIPDAFPSVSESSSDDPSSPLKDFHRRGPIAIK